MQYMSIKNIYYADPENVEAIYRARYDAPFTKHFPCMIQQIGRSQAYPAFLCYTEELASLLESVYKKFEQFLFVLYHMPPVALDQFSLLCIVDEVKSTNDIEGVYSTRREIRDILDGTAKTNRLFGIVNTYFHLMGGKEIPFDTPADIRTFYDGFVHEEIAGENPRNRLDGKMFRKESVDISTATGKIIHRGLFPESKIIAYMSEALQILHDKEIPTLVRLALFHYFFGYIHPFYDGNGRTGRFILSYFLAKHFHPVVALRFSVTAKRRQKMYYGLFRQAEEEINRGDVTPFVQGLVSMLAETFEDVNKALGRKMVQMERCKERLFAIIPLDELTRMIYFLLLQAGMFYGQGVSVQKLMELTGKSRNTVRARLEAMPPGHLVIRKSKAYRYKLNMLLFKDILG